MIVGGALVVFSLCSFLNTLELLMLTCLSKSRLDWFCFQWIVLFQDIVVIFGKMIKRRR